MLATLAARPGAAVRRRELREAAWPQGGVVHDNTLDAHVARLRRKLSALPDPPRIETVHGVGYSLR
jgi:two-component system response regulator MprA